MKENRNTRGISLLRGELVFSYPLVITIFFCSLKLEYFTVSRVLLGKKLKLQMVPRIPLKRSGNVTFLATAMKPETFVLELHFYRLQSCLVFGKCINLSTKHWTSAAFSPNEFLLKLVQGG